MRKLYNVPDWVLDKLMEQHRKVKNHKYRVDRLIGMKNYLFEIYKLADMISDYLLIRYRGVGEGFTENGIPKYNTNTKYINIVGFMHPFNSLYFKLVRDGDISDKHFMVLERYLSMFHQIINNEQIDEYFFFIYGYDRFFDDTDFWLYMEYVDEFDDFIFSKDTIIKYYDKLVESKKKDIDDAIENRYGIFDEDDIVKYKKQLEYYKEVYNDSSVL